MATTAGTDFLPSSMPVVQPELTTITAVCPTCRWADMTTYDPAQRGNRELSIVDLNDKHRKSRKRCKTILICQ